MWPYLEGESLQRECSYNEVLRVGSKSVWLVFLQKEEIWTQTCTQGEGRDEDEGRDDGDTPASQGIPKADGQKLGRRQGTDSPSESSEGTSPADTLILDFKPPELWNNRFLLFKLFHVWILLRQPEQTNTKAPQSAPLFPLASPPIPPSKDSTLYTEHPSQDSLCRDAASYCYDFLIIIFIYLFIWLCQVFSCSMRTLRASLIAQLVKSPPAMQETTGLTPGSGRSPGEGIDYPLQYSWVSLVAQTVKIPPAVWETWIQSMSWEEPLEKGKATLSSILAWRIPMDRGAWQVTVHAVTKCWTQLSD